MKSLFLVAPLAMIAALPAYAQSSRTTSVDRPNYEGTRTVSRDGEGTVTRDTDVTRKSDGATASHDYTRTATGDGWTANGSTTGFNGQTSSASASKVRNANGSVTTGTATGPNGNTYGYSGSRTRTGNGYTASQSVTNGDGSTLWSRNKAVARGPNGSVRAVGVNNYARGYSRGRVGFRRR